jgi:hypothetical protein
MFSGKEERLGKGGRGKGECWVALQGVKLSPHSDVGLELALKTMTSTSLRQLERN